MKETSMNRFPLLAAAFWPPSVAVPMPSQPAPVKQSFDAFRAGRDPRAHEVPLQRSARGPRSRHARRRAGHELHRRAVRGARPRAGRRRRTYFQKVSLLGITTDRATSRRSRSRRTARRSAPLKYRDEFVGGNQSQMESVTLDSEVVFVGHGVVAPEYRWDDYKGLDARGKTLVMLVDDPPATEKEPDLFRGRARTYYGRWTYKYEMGTARGARRGDPHPHRRRAGYGWQVVRNSWRRRAGVREESPRAARAGVRGMDHAEEGAGAVQGRGPRSRRS